MSNCDIKELVKSKGLDKIVEKWVTHLDNDADNCKEFIKHFNKTCDILNQIYDEYNKQECTSGFSQERLDIHQQQFDTILTWIASQVFANDPKHAARLIKMFAREHQRYITQKMSQRRKRPISVPLEAELSMMDVKQETDPKKLKEAEKEIDVEQDDMNVEDEDDDEDEGDEEITDSDLSLLSDNGDDMEQE